MAVSSIKAKKKVASALRQHASSMSDWVRWKKGTSKMRPDDANSFILGVMLDRSVNAERAWDAAEWICSAIGDSSDVRSLWVGLRDMERLRLLGFLRYGYGGKAFHRHYKTFARLLPLAADHLLEKYDGDPRKIWNSQRDISIVRRRLDEIPAIGPALARMAVLGLARDYGLLGGKKARRQLDVKPDVHLQRVFVRAGLIPDGSPPQSAVEAARLLAPDFPGSLDAPAWEIGRNWCRPQKPACKECPISAACARVGV